MSDRDRSASEQQPTFRPRWSGTAPGRGAIAGVLAALLVVTGFGPVVGGRSSLVAVIVRASAGHLDAAEHAVRKAGGEVGVRLPLIGGFAARVTASMAATLGAAPGIASITRDATVRLSGSAEDSSTPAPGTMAAVDGLVGATDLWSRGFDGSGIDVALIDSGVSPVDGLKSPGKVVNGPDLSFDRQAGAPAYLDAYGHGTHLAGIIAGRQDGVAGGGNVVGVAPGARIVNVKVASAGGETDVSQVIAAIDWVTQHRTSNGLNIRVLNLSFGTDSVQDPGLDPLAYAVEVAWRRGIVVVVAAGNGGDHRRRLADPALDPFVLAVGAADTHGTSDASDDTVPGWSSPGDETRSPDLVAPGVGVPGPRVPGSLLDLAVPSPTGSPLLRGTGTSQAAAIVSGAAALLLDERPNLTPDQVKALLTSTATPLPAAGATAQGDGLLNLAAASAAPVPSSVQRPDRSRGTGDLEGARGTMHVQVAGSVLQGERDIFGAAWDANEWAESSWELSTWHDGTWNDRTWTGKCLCATSWSGPSWSGLSWSGLSWSGSGWSGLSWSGLSWSGLSWSGLSWSGLSWSGLSWSGLSWSGQSWSGLSWSGFGWSTIDWSGS